MKRHHLATLAALTLALGLTLPPGRAFAQAPPPAAPPVASAAPPAPSAAPVAAPVSAVRVHLRTYRGKGTARLYIHRTDGSYTFVCASPCTADMAVNSELRVTLANNDEEPHTFVMPGDLGSEVDLEVRPASAGPLVGSIVLMGSGGALVLSGLLFVALSDLRYPTGGRSSSDPEAYKTVGFVLMGLGVGMAVGGLVWLLNRSHEPKVEGAPHGAPDLYGRRDTLLGDVAVQKPRDATTAILPPSTPFELSFTF